MSALAGYGKTISAQQNFDGLHVWDRRKTPPLDSRARQVGRASRAAGGGYPICPRRAFLAYHALHAPSLLEDVFSILRRMRGWLTMVSG
jgi:hypothetical protein